jgi:hypothetical protein
MLVGDTDPFRLDRTTTARPDTARALPDATRQAAHLLTTVAHHQVRARRHERAALVRSVYLTAALSVSTVVALAAGLVAAVAVTPLLAAGLVVVSRPSARYSRHVVAPLAAAIAAGADRKKVMTTVITSRDRDRLKARVAGLVSGR